jgi:hypothetical protein
MEFYPDDGKWDYWARIERWTHIQATLALGGIIPSKRKLYEAEYGEPFGDSKDPVFTLGLREISNFINAKFGKSDVSPGECLKWAAEKEFRLDDGLYLAAQAAGLLPKRSGMTGTGEDDPLSHHQRKRYAALELALSFLNRPPSGYAKFHPTGTTQFQNSGTT